MSAPNRTQVETVPFPKWHAAEVAKPLYLEALAHGRVLLAPLHTQDRNFGMTRTEGPRLRIKIAHGGNASAVP